LFPIDHGNNRMMSEQKMSENAISVKMEDLDTFRDFILLGVMNPTDSFAKAARRTFDNPSL